MRKRYLVAAALVLVVAALAVGTVVAGAGVERDKVPPSTVTDVAPHYWNDVAIAAHANDASGIAYVYYEFDGGVMRVVRVDAAPMDAVVQLSMLPSDAVTPSPDASPAPQPHPLLDPTSGGTHSLTYWAQDALGNVGARQTVTFEVGKDREAPTTSVTDAADGGWYHDWVRVKLTAQDNGTSGVAALVYSVDGGTPATVAGPAPQVVVPVVGDRDSRAIQYAASDLAGNTEATKTITVHFDNVAPTVAIRDASVRKGALATVKFQVNDATPNGGTAAVTINIRRYGSGRAVKTIERVISVNKLSTAKFRCRLARGQYAVIATATDTAGNPAAPSIASIAELRVR